MALIVGTNSFVTLTEANDYMNDRFGGSGWFTLTNASKEELLTTAFRWLVGEGVAKSNTTELVKWGQIELAWWIYRYFEEFEDREALIAGGVTKFKLSKWEEDLEKTGLPKKVKDLVADALSLGGYFPDYDRELEN
jgi:hypothetical protein